MLNRNFFLLWIAAQLFLNEVKGQSVSIQQGVVFRKGTTIRIANAEILNKRSTKKVTSNDFGIFRIVSLKNDTLQISGAGYEPKTIIVDNFKDTILYLTPTNLLTKYI